ncbi:MAG: ComEA family DNA-binding protein [Actinomycetaceae bacterium]|nr:ComEA family DNA-binding protein [Actinomycetaceae bacterium]
MTKHSRLRNRAMSAYAERLSVTDEDDQPRTIARFLPSPAAAIALVIALTAVFAIVLIRPQPSAPPRPVDELVAGDIPAVDATVETSPSPATLIVQVTGAVVQPGVVEVPVGSRGLAAISQAGGLSDDAELASVNLAAPLVDGQHIHVRAVGEVASAASTAQQCVDIRAADATQLESLSGIGPALAQRIIDYRSAQPFTSPDDVRAVSGIGAKTFERFKDQLCP